MLKNGGRVGENRVTAGREPLAAAPTYMEPSCQNNYLVTHHLWSRCIHLTGRITKTSEFSRVISRVLAQDLIINANELKFWYIFQAVLLNT
jgi:hypothetical protein